MFKTRCMMLQSGEPGSRQVTSDRAQVDDEEKDDRKVRERRPLPHAIAFLRSPSSLHLLPPDSQIVPLIVRESEKGYKITLFASLYCYLQLFFTTDITPNDSETEFLILSRVRDADLRATACAILRFCSAADCGLIRMSDGFSNSD